MHGAAQGPYSDIYAVGGVAYRAIGGTLADARVRQQAALSHQPDPLVPAVEVGRGRYPHDMLRAIDRALAVSAEERPQRVEDMLNLLDDDRTINRKTLFAADGLGWLHESEQPRRAPCGNPVGAGWSNSGAMASVRRQASPCAGRAYGSAAGRV